MNKRLWNYFDGEPFLDNPRLFVFNKRRKKQTKKSGGVRMRRTRRRKRARARVHVRRRVRRVRRTAARRSVYLGNPRRRGRRRARRNPAFGGLGRGTVLGFNLKDLGYGAGAIMLEPFVERAILGVLPTSISGTTYGRWGVKIGSTVLLGYGARRFLGKRAGDVVMIALGANILADLAEEFVPTVTGSLRGMGAYTQQGLGAYTRRGLGYVNPGAVALPSRGLSGALSLSASGVSSLAPSFRSGNFEPKF